MGKNEKSNNKSSLSGTQPNIWNAILSMHVISTWPLSHESDVNRTSILDLWVCSFQHVCVKARCGEQILEYLKAWLTTFTVMINTVGEGKEDAKQVDFDNLALSH